jgi:8-oxo-dGTP pyrophosphatase MutT (NUDIX family)
MIQSEDTSFAYDGKEEGNKKVPPKIPLPSSIIRASQAKSSVESSIVNSSKAQDVPVYSTSSETELSSFSNSFISLESSALEDSALGELFKETPLSKLPAVPLPGLNAGMKMKKEVAQVLSVKEYAKKMVHPKDFFPSPKANDFTIVRHEVTAGGIVVNDNKEIALIQRRSAAGILHWCLPKGHLEGSETEKTAAVREVFEETGLEAKIVKRIGSFSYRFIIEDTQIHKKVTHFLMQVTGGNLTVENDPDHEAEDVAFIAVSDVFDLLTYKNEKKLVKKALEELNGATDE